MSSAAIELAVLGGPDSGKTHYAGQLYGRVTAVPDGDCSPALSLRAEDGPPPDLSLLEDVLDALAEGRTAPHTPTGSWGELRLPLRDLSGRALDLRWPDYGGEQVHAMMKAREVPDDWRGRLTRSRGWLVLIRLSKQMSWPDALADLDARRADDGRPAVNTERQTRWDANAWWVEFFQLLLHVSGRGTARRLSDLPLAVVLSCHDELEAGGAPPVEVLARRLPLLAKFVDSTWSRDRWSVWGLSALGRPLSADGEDADYIEHGPETQGYVIRPEGGDTARDLTLPLAWLLERA